MHAPPNYTLERKIQLVLFVHIQNNDTTMNDPPLRIFRMTYSMSFVLLLFTYVYKEISVNNLSCSLTLVKVFVTRFVTCVLSEVKQR